jgi:DNA invertase Pin-like site-specific DNA recombinase
MGRGKVPEAAHGVLVGYARVSTEDQSLDLQISALRRAGVLEDNLHVEKASGASVKRRQGLRYALMDCREGDTLVVWKLDRLTRYMPDLYWILAELERKGASLRSLTEHLDTTTASGRLGMNMATSFAQYERETIAERTKAGLAVIRELRGKGWKWGPKPKMTAAKIKRAGHLLNVKKLSGPEVARRLKVSAPSIYGHWVRNPKWTKDSKSNVPRFIPRKK